jgi:hypothetical protein
MFHCIVPASFQNVHEAREVAVHVCVGILQRIPDSGLGSQMNNDLGFFSFKEVRHTLSVGKIENAKPEPGALLQDCKTIILESNFVVCIEVVHPDNIISVAQEFPRQMKTDESRYPCY